MEQSVWKQPTHNTHHTRIFNLRSASAFASLTDPNPTVVAFDALTNTTQMSRTTHAFVTGAMVSALLAASGAVPPVAIQIYGLLQVMPLARVVAYRPIVCGQLGVTSSVAGAIGGRFVIESGGEFILDTASATNTTTGGTTTPNPAPTPPNDSVISELGGDGTTNNGGKLVVLSGKLRMISPYLQRGNNSLLELSINTELHHNTAMQSVVGGTGSSYCASTSLFICI